MARRKIKVMISSRCNDVFPAGAGRRGTTLSDIRRRIKEELEAETLLGEEVFEVWINEDEPPEPGARDSWDHCLTQVRSADLLLVLYNGNAGWCSSDSDVGICHAEFMTAFNEAPGKISVVSLLDGDRKRWPANPQDRRFQEFAATANLFHGESNSTPDDVVRTARRAIREQLLNIALRGAKEERRNRYSAGAALLWSRMDFPTRQAAMLKELRQALADRNGAQEEGDAVTVPIGGKRVLFLPAAIPAAMTIAAAREMVGQPFLRDHHWASTLKGKIAGPVHVVACHRSATERQAIALLGFPDATIVSGSFGVYVADNIQKIQLCLVANCRDASSTRLGLHKLFDWLMQTGEDDQLAERATSRSKIVGAIAKEAAP